MYVLDFQLRGNSRKQDGLGVTEAPRGDKEDTSAGLPVSRSTQTAMLIEVSEWLYPALSKKKSDLIPSLRTNGPVLSRQGRKIE